jgi:hypothetical protein
MQLDWKSVTAEHVRQAYQLIVARGGHQPRKGLVVYIGDYGVSAKDTLREAYRLAKGLPSNAEVRFASGEATLNMFRRLGFRAERLD